jgi:hypothetical protein
LFQFLLLQMTYYRRSTLIIYTLDCFGYVLAEWLKVMQIIHRAISTHIFLEGSSIGPLA